MRADEAGAPLRGNDNRRLRILCHSLAAVPVHRAAFSHPQRARHGMRQRVHVHSEQEGGVLAVFVSVPGHIKDPQSEVRGGQQFPVRLRRLLGDETRDLQQVLSVRPAQRPVVRDKLNEREEAVFHARRFRRLHCGRGRRLRKHWQLLRFDYFIIFIIYRKPWHTVPGNKYKNFSFFFKVFLGLNLPMA